MPPRIWVPFQQLTHRYGSVITFLVNLMAEMYTRSRDKVLAASFAAERHATFRFFPSPDRPIGSGHYIGRDLQRVAVSLRLMLNHKWDAHTEAASFGLCDPEYHDSALNTDTRPRWWVILEESARCLQTPELIRHPFLLTLTPTSFPHGPIAGT